MCISQNIIYKNIYYTKNNVQNYDISHVAVY